MGKDPMDEHLGDFLPYVVRGSVAYPPPSYMGNIVAFHSEPMC